MNDTQNLLLKVIGTALFGEKTPIAESDQLMLLINESKAQTVYPLVFSVLDEQLQEKRMQ